MRSLLLMAVVSALPGSAYAGRPPLSGGPEQRIAYYAGVLADHPERYPLRVSLAQACLAQARQSLDPAAVARARAELRRSLETQESFEAYVVFAQVENFAHRFEAALSWVDKAASASPDGGPTPDLQAMRMEALLGLGRTAEVEALVAQQAPDQPRFEWSAARGRLRANAKQFEDGARWFAQAAELAASAGQKEWAGWARVQQAACHLDHGSPARALPALETAEMLIPNDADLALHRAEHHQAQGEWKEATGIYESLLTRANHPLYHHLAWRATLRLGRESLAKTHFQAAEQGYRRVVEAGEIYTLGALARLYAEAGAHLEEALRLARRNLAHVRDREAVETLAQVEKALK